ncbi:Ig-like domain-containing protein [Robinsoniella peoriensis]|uniref:Bacterial Ig-like domain (Group 2) n=1 Tax=Robinsoniella peoriensis TaxID=180332 RepID=A0A4U8Q598_9FIRM|nr:Ig-like domain-containing protein [Robinsoniella peoriensis]TLC99182.1 Bacterial Ig-like domain (group 2) [Robinsoniella peoriensis]
MRRINKNRNINFRMLTILILLVFTMLIPVEAQAAKLNKKTLTLQKGKTYTIKMQETKKRTSWKISKPSIARVVGKTKTSINIKAMRIGKTDVSGRVQGKTYKCKVRVVDPKLNVSKISLKAGSTKLLKVTGGTGKIKWSTSNRSLATVTNGKVTAKKAGTVKIFATQNKKKLTCTVTVLQKTSNGSQAKPDATPGVDAGADKKLVEKKVWVVTQEAWIEYVPVYINKRSEFECCCGKRFKDANDYGEHVKNVVNEGDYSHGRYRVVTVWDSVHYEEIYHDEVGYWKTEYVYE